MNLRQRYDWFCLRPGPMGGFMGRIRSLLSLLCALFVTMASGVAGADAIAAPPFLWDPNKTLEKPDLSSIRQIRFLTEDDFPPFNFQLPDGQLGGFNVELARAICAELEVTCSIQRRNWDLLIPSLNDNSGDAVISSIAINNDTRKDVEFTAPYFLTPGRFVLRKDSPVTDVSPKGLGDRPVAVVAGSRHEAFLTAFYPKAVRVTFETPTLARSALKAGRVQAVFGDAITLSYWLNGLEAQGCCLFRGGPFIDPRFFGEGVGIAVKTGNVALRRALDYALARLARHGTYGELYLKYFPIGPF